MENLPPVVSREAWIAARQELLAKEKEQTRARDQLNTQRRELPMVAVAHDYQFEGPDGPVSLLDLFDGRDQLVVQHVMYAADWADPCSSCAAGCDEIPPLRQLHARNTSFVAISRAPYAKLAAVRARMNWSFPWVSSHGSAFNDDFQALIRLRATPIREDRETEIPGFSAFLRVGDQVYYTYSTTARGVELLFSNYPILDITVLGRQEEWESPKGRSRPLGLEAGGPAVRMPDQLKT